MILQKRNNSKIKNFWVIEYTDQDKLFFLNLGFSCDEFRKTLNFRGSKSFGIWNDKEFEKIYNAVKKQYGSCKPLKLSLAELI